MSGDTGPKTKQKRAASRVTEYPPSPGSLPPGFLSTPLGYRLRVVLVLVGLLLFVAIYLGLVYATVMAFPALYSLDLPMGRGTMYLMIGGSVLLAAVLTFLVKGLFHRKKREPGELIELEREDEPELFAFLDQLVKETGAPRPAHVYVTGAVTAAVFYEPSLLSLVWPVRKNLLIGLGLVNHLTRSELKAVLGHELGHFSQRSMKVGSYVYVTSDVVRGILDPDWFDDMIESGKRSDARIAIVALMVQGFVGLIRWILRMLFGLLVIGHRSLSREMELAADRVAVSVAGSDAIARGLYKAELADACSAATSRVLVHAGDHGLHTRDFFHHQARILPEVRRHADRPTWGEVPAGTTRFLFTEDGVSKPSMWATHPPSSERERAARARFVESAHDERSAWTFFRDPDGLRERVTASMMRPPGSKEVERKPAAEIEAFLEAERAEVRSLERFGEMFTGRSIAKVDLPAIFEGAATPTADELDRALAGIPLDEITTLSKKFRSIQKEAQLLQRARAGGVRAEALVHRGTPIRSNDEIPALLRKLDAEIKAIDTRFEALDADLLRTHAGIAKEIAADRATTLRRRYALILRLQGALEALRLAHARTMPYLAVIHGGGRLGEAQSGQFIAAITAVRNTCAEVLERAEGRKLPAMENVKAGTDLAAFLLSHRLQHPQPEPEIVGLWIGRVLADAGEMLDKLERLHKKTIAGMVAMYDYLALEWRTRREGGEMPAEKSAAETSSTENDAGESGGPEA